MGEVNKNIPKKYRKKKKKFLSNDMSKVYNFQQIPNKKVESQKKQIQEAIPYVLSKADLLKIKKFQNREAKSNIKESHSRQRIRPQSQSIYSGKNIPIIQSDLGFQQIGFNKANAKDYQIMCGKDNQSFITVQPNIYGNSHQIVQGLNGDTFLVPIKSGIQRVKKRNQSNGNLSYCSKENSQIKQAIIQDSLSNFGSVQNLDQFQVSQNFQRNSVKSGDQLRSDILLSHTTSIKREHLEKAGNMTSDFWYYNQRGSSEKGINHNHQKGKYQYKNNARQSVNLQDSQKPEFLIYSHNPSLRLPNPKKGDCNLMKRSALNQHLSGKSLNKGSRKRRIRKGSNLGNMQSRSSQFHKIHSGSEHFENDNSYKEKLKTVEKDLKDMNLEDLKFVFEILDAKKQGFISKNNFKFTNLPLKTMNSMEPFIKEMLVREGTLDFNQYLDLIQTLIQKDSQ